MSESTVKLATLEATRHLVETRQYWELERRLSKLGRETLLVDRDLGYSMAVALLHLRRTRDGLALVEDLRTRWESSRDTLAHRIELLRSIFLGRNGRLDEAEDSACWCVSNHTATTNKKYAASANNSLGVILGLKGEWDAAVPQLQRTLSLYRQLGDRFGVGTVSHNLGLATRYMGRYQEAQQFFSAASEYFLVDGITEEEVFTESERSLAVLGMGDEQLAERMARRALERCRRIDNWELLGEALRVLGIVQRECNNYADARQSLQESYQYARRADSVHLRAEVHMEIGLLQADRGRADVARRHLRRAALMFTQLGALGFARMAMKYAEATVTPKN